MWRELTPNNLLTRLAAAEKQALATAATDSATVLEDIASDVAEEWRGRLARVTALSVRPLALPSEIFAHVLADYRYRAYTRLPGMSALLDELRVAEWERAVQVMDNLAKVQIAPPEADDLPEEDAPAGGSPLPLITVPIHELD